MQIYDRQHIEKLGLTDPIVRSHLGAQRFIAGLTWEEMLHAMVVSLVEAKDAAIATATDYAMRMPAPSITSLVRNPDAS